MFKICDFCGAKEERDFEKWGTIVMDGVSVKNSHTTMDLCEKCMNEVVETYRKLYVEKRTGVIQTLPNISETKEEKIETKSESKTKRKASTKKSTNKKAP